MPVCDERKPFLLGLNYGEYKCPPNTGVQLSLKNWRIQKEKPAFQGKGYLRKHETTQLLATWPTTREKDPTPIHEGVTIYSFQMLQ